MAVEDIAEALELLGVVYGNFFDYISIPLAHFSFPIIVTLGTLGILTALLLKFKSEK